MLPGKSYKPEDILLVLRKRAWVIVLPWAIVAAATAVVARKLPDIYRSTAMLQVVPPQVPESIVQKPTTQSLEKAIQVTHQNITSRTKLEGIIRDHGLYQDEQRRGDIMQDIVERMRREITVQPLKGDAFTVSYVGRNPSTVMKVTETLAGFFRDESRNQSEVRADTTNAFVESTVEDARRKLQANEDALTRYKLLHAGELPEQLQANMSAIGSLQSTLNNIAQSISQDTNAKATLDRSIENLENQADPAGIQGPLPVATGGAQTAAQRLAAAKATLESYELRGYTAQNPEMIYIKGVIKQLTLAADEEALKSPVSAAGALSPAEQLRQTRLAEWRDQSARLQKQIEANKAEQKRLLGQVAVYQARIDKAPIRDAELVTLMRDHGTLTGIYNDLLGKREVSSMTVNLARRQIGEQFVLLDPARLPEKPESPNRLMINVFGILTGLALGVGLAALLEYRDSAFRTDSEISSVLALPVLAVVPLMRSDAERRTYFRRRVIINLGLASTVMVCFAVLAYTFVYMR